MRAAPSRRRDTGSPTSTTCMTWHERSDGQFCCHVWADRVRTLGGLAARVVSMSGTVEG